MLKQKSSLLLVAAAVSWLAIEAIGQNPPRGRGQDLGEQDPGPPPRPEDGPDGPPPPPFGPPPNFLFEAIDTDNDGELSPKEIAKAGETILKLDKNKDGIISEFEVRPPPPGGGRPGGPPRANNAQDAKALVDSVMRFDKNGDGKVTAAELPERMARMLEQGDTNKDGALERSEVETLARCAPARRPGPPGGGPPGFGPPGGPPVPAPRTKIAGGPSRRLPGTWA